MKRDGTFGSQILDLYKSLRSPGVPRGVAVMNPYANAAPLQYVNQFLTRYFADKTPRLLIFGINPGRFGAGITGVTFTDPVVLADICGIRNDLPRRRELSSIFIYDLIERMGGAQEFYRRYFLTALSPLGFTSEGKNLNYYDNRALERAVTPFIAESIRKHLAAGGRSDCAIILGTGANMKFMQRLNAEHSFFHRIYAMEHPRFIMQYRRKRLDEYIARYTNELRYRSTSLKARG